jgi:cytochrome c oxidase subunit IV
MAHAISHDQAHDPANVTNPEHAEHHIVTPVQYCMVFGALLLGTAITVAAAYVNFGAFNFGKYNLGVLNPIIALAIASTKAVIVILFFMHVKYQSRLIKLTVACGFFTFVVLIMMTLCDYMSRSWGLW